MTALPVPDQQLDSPTSSSVVSTGEAVLMALAYENRTLRYLLGLSPRAKQSKVSLGPMLGLLAAGPVLFAARDFLGELSNVSSVFDALKAVSGVVDYDSLVGKDSLLQMFDSPELEQPGIVVTSTPVSTPGSYSVPSSAMARPSEHVEGVLRRVSTTTKVDYATLYALAGTESNFKATARAGTSSAVGMMQFTEGTWKYLTTKVFPQLGYTLDDRLDPEKSATMAALYVTQISNTLQNSLGRKPSVGDLYLGYFLGPGGAVKFLKAMQSSPDSPSAALFPSAASANVNLFYTKDGRPMSLVETYMKITGRISSYYAQATNPSSSTQLAAVTPTARATPSASTVVPATETEGKNTTVTVQLPPVEVSSADTPQTLMPLGRKPNPSYTYTRDRNDRLVLIPT